MITEWPCFSSHGVLVTEQPCLSAAAFCESVYVCLETTTAHLAWVSSSDTRPATPQCSFSQNAKEGRVEVHGAWEAEAGQAIPTLLPLILSFPGALDVFHPVKGQTLRSLHHPPHGASPDLWADAGREVHP